MEKLKGKKEQQRHIKKKIVRKTTTHTHTRERQRERDIERRNPEIEKQRGTRKEEIGLILS